MVLSVDEAHVQWISHLLTASSVMLLVHETARTLVFHVEQPVSFLEAEFSSLLSPSTDTS